MIHSHSHSHQWERLGWSFLQRRLDLPYNTIVKYTQVFSVRKKSCIIASQHYLEEIFVFCWSASQGSRFPDTPPPARHLCKLDLLLRLAQGKFVLKTTTCLENRSSLISQFFFCVLPDGFPGVFKFYHWPFGWDDSFHSWSEEECMMAFLQCWFPFRAIQRTLSFALDCLPDILKSHLPDLKQHIHMNLRAAVPIYIMSLSIIMWP